MCVSREKKMEERGKTEFWRDGGEKNKNLAERRQYDETRHKRPRRRHKGKFAAEGQGRKEGSF
jgi:hypothetical protein